MGRLRQRGNLGRALRREGYEPVLCNAMAKVDELNTSLCAKGSILLGVPEREMKSVYGRLSVVTMGSKGKRRRRAPHVTIDLPGAYRDVGVRLRRAGCRRVGYCCDAPGLRASWDHKFRYAELGHQNRRARCPMPRPQCIQRPARVKIWAKIQDGARD